MYRTWVEISLARLSANYEALKAAAGGDVLVCPVLKADAYRHGAETVGRHLERRGARWMAVSNAQEGVELRQAGVKARILVMGDFLEYERAALADYDLTPVIHSLARLREYANFAGARREQLPYHLKIDTGMGRLGVRSPLSEVVATVAGAVELRLEGLLTHLASAPDFTSTQTDEQIANFGAALRALAEAGLHPPLIHLASSTPLVHGMRGALGNMARPGLALYGYVSPAAGPAPALVAEVSPVLTWKARVLEIKQIPAGAPVGYGARWRALAETRVGVVAAGYADGIPPGVSNRGNVIAAGRLAPILGAVSMDLTSVDLSACPEVRIGDAVTLLGREGSVKNDADDIARQAGIISYAVLCGIGNRVQHVYV